MKFLETFSFLFFRFRPGAYSYPLALLLRNLGLALVPVIVDETLELSAVAIVVMMCVLYCVSVLPWAVPAANYLDIVLHTGFLFIVFLAALQTDIADDIVVGNMLLTVFSGVLCGFLGAGLYCVRLCWLRVDEALPVLPLSPQGGWWCFLPTPEDALHMPPAGETWGFPGFGQPSRSEHALQHRGQQR